MIHNTPRMFFHGMAAAGLLALTACAEESPDAAQSANSQAGAATQSTQAGQPGEGAAATQSGNGNGEAAESAAQVGEDGAFYGDYVVGDENAPITLVEYASFTCGHCASFHKLVYPKLMENYIEPGKVKFVFRHYVRDGADVAASVVARCQGKERFGAMKDLFFDRQAQWLSGVKTIEDAMDNLAAVARRAGVSRAEFDRCMANQDIQNHVIEMTREGADQFEITGTPTLVMNGEVLPLEANRYEELDRILSEELS